MHSSLTYQLGYRVHQIPKTPPCILESWVLEVCGRHIRRSQHFNNNPKPYWRVYRTPCGSTPRVSGHERGCHTDRQLYPLVGIAFCRAVQCGYFHPYQKRNTWFAVVSAMARYNVGCPHRRAWDVPFLEYPIFYPSPEAKQMDKKNRIPAYFPKKLPFIRFACIGTAYFGEICRLLLPIHAVAALRT